MSFNELTLIKAFPFETKSPVLVDVGAHQGSFSKAFAQCGWYVVAFEPEQHNFAVLQEKISQLDNIVLISKAVSDTSDSSQAFYVSKEHYGIHSLKPFHKTHRLAYNVETVRLDQVLTELRVSQVSLLKIDIEGADFLALKSFSFDVYRPELVMVEFMDERSKLNFDYTHHDMAQFMNSKGYVTFVSEWEPIKEYGREGVSSNPHVWIQCVPYPLNHEPAWGNLIFVPKENQDKFAKTLENYLKSLKFHKTTMWLRQALKKIPGAAFVYRQIIKAPNNVCF
ncbi:MAG: FkbM family methyltransferase [Leptolyngbyaceae cyanobacterium SM1_1_3]|nr:FkbM family methyltransferase [Leptolyngbyaceae cyanobacterium SM1_1_3]NJO11780.1 FkbM family methyltransferase [Leptolyngbyaceae cyanobacterium SL_1_1]